MIAARRTIAALLLALGATLLLVESTAAALAKRDATPASTKAEEKPSSPQAATLTPNFGIASLDLDVNAADKNNQTALHYAVIGTVDEPELVTALLKRGANPEARDRWGQTPLILAAHQNLTRSVQALLDQGANVNAENEDGYTALVAASKHGNALMTKALLDKGADPNIRFRNLGELPTRPKTETALILAAQNGTVEVVRLLLAHGANASAQDADGRAPLTAAIRARNGDSVRVLLAAGANPRAKFRFSNDGPDAPLLITPLLFATQHNDSSIAKLLLGIPTEESGATAKEKAI